LDFLVKIANFVETGVKSAILEISSRFLSKCRTVREDTRKTPIEIESIVF
jgi:hypothetical protein